MNGMLHNRVSYTEKGYGIAITGANIMIRKSKVLTEKCSFNALKHNEHTCMHTPHIRGI